MNAVEEQNKLIFDEVEVVWLCSKCLHGGTLRFKNHTSVGDRLRLAKTDHHSTSPNCEVDWDKIIVQNAVFYKSGQAYLIKPHTVRGDEQKEEI